MKRFHGFTLIELLIVVAIIGILAAIAVPNFLNALTRAKVARAVSNMKTVSLALETYFLDYNSYTEWAWDPLYTGFHQLTAPVAYMNSLDTAKNPFKEKANEALLANAGRELDPYFELGTWSRGGSTSYALEYPRTVFLLESAGPDVLDDYNANNFPQRGLIYQSTNGLLSKGDIYRGGGSHLPEWAATITY